MRDAILDKEPGDTVEITIVRAGEEQDRRGRARERGATDPDLGIRGGPAANVGRHV